jgi:NADH-quinone oxidoreductase subunit A
MLEQYLPVLLQVLIATGFAAVTLLISVMLGRAARRNKMKDSAYECGMLPIGDAQPRFSVKFYIVAMLFVMFDIEVVFLYPWAVIFKDAVAVVGASVFWWMLGFVGILLVAFGYAWKKGALRWDS